MTYVGVVSGHGVGSMRQRKWRAFRRGWVALYILGIGGFGALASGWNGLPRHGDLSAAQAVALRFPEDAADEPDADGPIMGGPLGSDSLALFSPHSMAPQTALRSEPTPRPPPSLDPKMEASLAEASPAEVSPVEARPPLLEPAAASSPPQRVASLALPVLHRVAPHPKPVMAAVHKATNRPGFVLNDAQIASIKRRLQLTPDQEQMWPAVEAALRGIAYARAHGEARGYRGATGSAQLAGIDPDSPEVQGLKSAAVPLIMSFNSEQKSEVRTLAHVMGLDQLASQF